jgi:UDP-glucose 4-epimerase
MGERILLTGGAGFIGSHLIRAYREAGHEVAVFDNLSTGHCRNLPAKIMWYKADIRDVGALRRACAEFAPTIVSHHAAQSSVKVSAREQLRTYEENVMGTANVLQAAEEAGVRRVVFASSGAVYGDTCDCGAVAYEECSAAPTSSYGLSKHIGEELVNFAPLEAVILRYGNVYGPGQDPQGEAGVIAVFAGKLLAGEPVTIFGDGKQTRDYIHVADVCRANVLALTAPPMTYNVATGTSTALCDLLTHLQDLTGNAKPPQYAPVTPGDARAVRLDVSRAQAHLGFSASVGLAEGLRQTVATMRNHDD